MENEHVLLLCLLSQVLGCSVAGWQVGTGAPQMEMVPTTQSLAPVCLSALLSPTDGESLRSCLPAIPVRCPVTK